MSAHNLTNVTFLNVDGPRDQGAKEWITSVKVTWSIVYVPLDKRERSYERSMREMQKARVKKGWTDAVGVLSPPVLELTGR